MPGTHLTLECKDVAAGASFFRDVLALPVRQRDGRSVEVDLGAVTATLTPRAEPTTGSAASGAGTAVGTPDPEHTEGSPALIVEVAVTDVREAIREMERRGAVVLVGPVITEWDTESAFVAGPDGVIVELYRSRGVDLREA